MANPGDELQVNVWALGALARLVRQGALDAPAPAADELAAASQRLLIETGWLDTDPLRPSQRLREVLPPGVPLSALSGYVVELLTMVIRYAQGAGGGWLVEDPDLIRWRAWGSGAVVGHLLDKAFAALPGFPQRLQKTAAGFLDVGVGGAGLAIALCQRYPNLRGVGIDIRPAVLAVAREDVVRAGLADRIELREQSVADVDDVDAFDLIWLPQPFLPVAVLKEALPRLHLAVGACTDVRNLVVGGGTIQPGAAEDLLAMAGFVGIQRLEPGGGIVVLAHKP